MITVVGDAELLYFAARVQFPVEQRRLHFGFFERESADYLWLIPSLKQTVLGGGWDDVINQEPAFRYTFKGTDYVQVFNVPTPHYEKPLRIGATQLGREVGRIEKRTELNEKLVVARPLRDHPGSLPTTADCMYCREPTD